MSAIKLIERNALAFDIERTVSVIDDFNEYTSGGKFTSVLTDSGSATVSDGAKGILALVPSDGTVADNDEAYIKTTKEIFKIADGKPCQWKALVQFTEANTDDANVFVGLKDAIAANSLVDDGGGPPSSYSGAVFFKVDGDTLWQAEYSNGGTQNTVRLSAANSLDKLDKTAGGSAYQKLESLIQPKTSSLCDVFFWIDNVLVCKMVDQSYSSATEMQWGAGVKNGGGNLETLNIDLVEVAQAR